MIKIRIESMDRYAINLIYKQIRYDFLSRKFISEHKLVNITDYHITEGTKDDLSYIEIECKHMNMIILPILSDRRIINQYTQRKEIFITLTPDNEDIVGDIANMIYNQYVGHEEYIENDVVLNFDDGKNIKVWIDGSCNKFPTFIFSKFYTADSK